MSERAGRGEEEGPDEQPPRALKKHFYHRTETIAKSPTLSLSPWSQNADASAYARTRNRFAPSPARLLCLSRSLRLSPPPTLSLSRGKKYKVEARNLAAGEKHLGNSE